MQGQRRSQITRQEVVQLNVISQLGLHASDKLDEQRMLFCSWIPWNCQNLPQRDLARTRLTFDVEVGWPVSDHVRRHAFATLMQAWVVDDTLPDGRSVEVVECRGKGGHRRDRCGIRRWGRVGAGALPALGRGWAGVIVTGGVGGVVDESHGLQVWKVEGVEMMSEPNLAVWLQGTVRRC